MRFQDLPAKILTVRVVQADGSKPALQEQPVFSVEASQTHPGEFEIRLKDSVALVQPFINADTRRLNSELASGSAILAQLANPAADRSIELQIAFFAGDCLQMGEVEIGVDEYIEDTIAKMEPRGDFLRGDRLYKILDQLCCFRQGDSEFFFLTAGPAIDRELKAEPEFKEKYTEPSEEESEAEESQELEGDAETNAVLVDIIQTRKLEPTRKNSFCVTGDGIRFVATEMKLPSGKSIFIATRLTKRNSNPDRAIRLAKGKLRFADWTKAGQIRIEAQAQLTAITKDDGSYLKKWDEFGALEGELLLKKAREVGSLQYRDMQQNRNGTVSVKISQASDSAWVALANRCVQEVEVVEQLPEYLKNEKLTFKEFVGAIEDEEVAKFKDNKKKRKEQSQQSETGRKEQETYVRVIDFDPDMQTITLETEILPSTSGLLILSLAGEIAQIKRRVFARRTILESRSANPNLGLLIEEKGKVSTTRPPHKTRALTAFVRGKIFRKTPPTVMQEKAIDVALNTPDIALVQGPPGTGKTTVIAAILERLNEIADKRGANVKGQVLLTGFQHDAVENMIDRISLNSIPVPKFGRRSGQDDNDFDAFERSLEEWCEKLAAEIREQNPEIVEIQREREIKNLCLQYAQAPTRTLAANLVGQIACLGSSILGEDVARKAANLEKNLLLEKRLNDKSDYLLNAVRRLRIHPGSFDDDGPERATDAIEDLTDTLDENEYALLDKASLWRREDGLPPFLNELAALKKKLLIRFATPPVFRVEKQSDEIITLAEEALKRIKRAGHSAKDLKSAALAEFLAELEGNPYGMIDAVADYSFAFAATCQQSVNRRMQIQKGIVGNDLEQTIEYDYVIVDEAARVSPRDLMIPMAQGKRIILVGDHRQLPHIVDESVIDALSEQEVESFLAQEGEFERDSQNWSNISLFEHMFVKRLPALEEQDDIPRRVTLDTQFRMHPLLGDFISRNFYERFDPAEKFSSGRPSSDFVHNLPNTDGKPAVWLDVKAEKGKQQKSGTSWVRPAEATAITQQLRTWMNSEAGKDLSFGVISFYKAQAELIRRQFGNLVEDDRKLRIGTVDSFQGMEFDIVFLSMVRTFPNNWKPKDNIREKQARGLFGHLCLYNRLNVSMSRQKKLLVVVGDSDLLDSDLADEFIPGLVDFLNLCRREGRVI